MQTGRWTILARAPSRQRRPSRPHLRARVVVRCVCGVQRTVWLEDLEQGRSTGCESRRCHARFLAVQDLRAKLTRQAVDRAQLYAASAEFSSRSPRERERIVDGMLLVFLAAIDRHLAESLTQPIERYDFDAEAV